MNIFRRNVRPRLSVTIALALVSPVVTAIAAAPAEGTAPPQRQQVILDYSPTLSDADALLYLASNPAVDLLGVTLAGTGEADCEPGTQTTRALLAVAGYADVPVGCGRNAPLSGDRDWPEEWRTEVNRWGAEILPPVDPGPVGDAEKLLVDTLSAATAPVTVVAVAPLTNLGVVLPAHPELKSRIERVVIMGGAVGVPGNVGDSPAAEWNIYIDPEAARQVLASGVPVTFVPLDATNSLPFTERLLARFAGLDGVAARTVHKMAASRPSLGGIYLWDELAAMTSVDPGLVTTEPMTVKIEDSGAVVRDPGGTSVLVAVDADADAATTELIRILNGGTVPSVEPLSAAERDYLMGMARFESESSGRFSKAFQSASQGQTDVHVAAAAFIDGFIGAVSQLATDIRGLTPPPSLADAHAAYLEALDHVVAIKPELVSGAAASGATTVDAVIGEAESRAGMSALVDQARNACQVLEDYSFLRDGPRPCLVATSG